MTATTAETRVKVDAYARDSDWCDGECTHDCNDDREDLAPKAFDALRAVLGWCELFDVAIGEYKPYEVSEFIRAAINNALGKEEV